MPLAYIHMMQTVVETPASIADCKAAGVSDGERMEIVNWIARHPQAGELIVGTGGARKVRLARQGGGKSGGYRTVHYFGGVDVPVFLLVLYAKGTRANIAPAERNQLKAILARIADSYRKGG
jgi:hypothetical protein